MGAKISKRYPSYKLQPKVLRLVLNFLQMVLTKQHLGFLNFEFPIFNDFFFQKFQIHHCSLWRNKTSIFWKKSDHRAKRSEIWDSRVVI